MDIRTDLCETNDHLFGRGLVDQKKFSLTHLGLLARYVGQHWLHKVILVFLRGWAQEFYDIIKYAETPLMVRPGMSGILKNK